MKRSIKSVIVFGGTSEGREIAEFLAAYPGVALTVCVATGYGEEVMALPDRVSVQTGRLSAKEMAELLAKLQTDICIDATHPYAKEVSVNIAEACAAAGVVCLRVNRAAKSFGGYVQVPSVEAAALYLQETQGNVLVTTGSKELTKYNILQDYPARCYVRVLPSAEAIEECRKCGYKGKNIIAMQGPFSEQLNGALIKEYNIKYMVTKNSGERGGFEEKCKAAEENNVCLIVVERPEENSCAMQMSLDELLKWLKERLVLEINVKESGLQPAEGALVSLVAMGPGSEAYMTAKAISVIREADLIIGAGRLLETAGAYIREDSKVINCYKNDEILNKHLRLNAFKKAVLLYSGDLGLSSGAKGMLKKLRAEGYLAEAVSGVSSAIYMLNSIGISWEEALIISAHGRKTDIDDLTRQIEQHQYTALLPYDNDQILQLLKKLKGEWQISFGSHLTLENERINAFSKNAENLVDYINTLDSLVVVVFEKQM